MLKQCFDPEIPVNIFDLGLIYEVEASEDAVKIQMTFTSKSCPAAQAIPDDVRKKMNTQIGIDEEAVEIDVVFEPAWSPALISEEGREILGIGT